MDTNKPEFAISQGGTAYTATDPNDPLGDITTIKTPKPNTNALLEDAKNSVAFSAARFDLVNLIEPLPTDTWNLWMYYYEQSKKLGREEITLELIAQRKGATLSKAKHEHAKYKTQHPKK